MKKNGENELPMNQVTAVVMLKMFGGHYAANQARLDLLLASLNHWGPESLAKNLVLVVPDDELDSATQLYGDRFRILSDSQVCPTVRNFSATNWVKQQFIKLAFYRHCETPFYMTLDPDNFATRPFCEHDLVRDGKGALDYTVKWDHADWWTSSADLLRLPHVDIPERVMLVTPCVYSIQAMRDMKSDVEAMYSDTWDKILLERFHFTDERPGWIENAIYFLSMVKNKTLEKYHLVERPYGQQPLHSTSEVWVKEQFDNWDPSHCFSEQASGIFSLVQGNTYIDPRLVKEKIGKFIGLTG